MVSLRFPPNWLTFFQRLFTVATEDLLYERCLNEAERILASEKDVIVPVKKVWEAVEKQGKKQRFEYPSLADFTALLEGDARFEFMSSTDENGDPITEFPGDDVDQEEELESLGFYSGDRVKLKSVELTPEVIGGLIRRKVDMTMDALARAWEQRPDGDQETEDQLLEILAKTQKLQREVRTSFSDERMKELQRALVTKEKAPAPGKKKPSAKLTTAAKKKRPAPKKRPTAASKAKSRKPASNSRTQRSRRT
ncbi:MAG: hypothetical protein B7Z63_05050 [Ignavibacteriae bacterium 37-53-5]|nr:MAG: hypothetical protein B7Z63_05050 [Ignavibacteriae bacterium 37-53-5]